MVWLPSHLGEQNVLVVEGTSALVIALVQEIQHTVSQNLYGTGQLVMRFSAGPVTCSSREGQLIGVSGPVMCSRCSVRNKYGNNNLYVALIQ